MDAKVEDKRAIDAVVQAFFAVFDNRGGRWPTLASLHDLCVAQCVIVKATPGGPVVYDLPGFIAPRDQLLRSGELVDFHEEEVWDRTDVFGDIGQRLSVYRKAGRLSGEPFETSGVKIIQFVRTGADWKISAVAWDDERAGLVIPELTA